MVKIGNREIGIAVAVVVLLFFFAILGMAGLRTIAGVFLFLFLPMFLILNNFDLSLGEKMIFSFFLGIGLFAIPVYYLALLFGSIRISMIVSFVLLILIGFLIKKSRKQPKQD